MISNQTLILGASVLWILLSMRFWYAIDREHVWQRRFIAIAAGVGGGLIYLIGTMMVEMLKDKAPEPSNGTEIRVSQPGGQHDR